MSSSFIMDSDEEELSASRSPSDVLAYKEVSDLWKRFTIVPVSGGLMRSTPDRAVRVRALAGDNVVCSWARHLTLTMTLSTQVYNWVPANLMLVVTL